MIANKVFNINKRCKKQNNKANKAKKLDIRRINS